MIKETLQVDRSYAFLSQYPNGDVQIIDDQRNWHAVTSRELLANDNQYYCDIGLGIIYLHESCDAKNITVRYRGIGYKSPIKSSIYMSNYYENKSKSKCLFCNGKGETEELVFTGAVVTPFTRRCSYCSGRGERL